MTWRNESEWLRAMNEVMGAGLFEAGNQSWPRRHARALRRYLEAAPYPAVEAGAPFYPSGAANLWQTIPEQAIVFSYSFSLSVDFGKLERKFRAAGAPEGLWHSPEQLIFNDLHTLVDGEIPLRFEMGGAAYTHSVLDYATLLASGLDGTRARWAAGMAAAATPEQRDWLAAAREVLDAIEHYVSGCADFLTEQGAEARLIDLFRTQIRTGARDFYGALGIFNFFWYLDDADSAGRFDAYLTPWYERATAAERAAAAGWLEALWRNFDARSGWHLTLGGQRAPGEAVYSELTELALRTMTRYRRPNAGLLVTPGMPDSCWDAVFDSFAAGGVNPALYNESGYQKQLAVLTGVAAADLGRLCYGGCTEVMFAGCSNVGSIDAGLHVLEILDCAVREHLGKAADFAAFYAAFEADLLRRLEQMFAALAQSQRNMAIYRPQLIRSLFVEDCLARATDYNAGGARYNGSVINLVGLSNTFNALETIRRCMAGQLPFGVPELLAMLRADFAGYDAELALVRQLPKFGNGDAGLDGLAARLARRIFDAINAHRIWRGDGYAVPAVILFTTYGWMGESVGATADGRRATAPVGDSVGAVQGTDRQGPTALLRSCAALPQEFGIGTLVLNLRVDGELVGGAVGRARLKALIQTYFEEGGLQIQFSPADPALLEAALADPDSYAHLMVRVGGYSEYFRNLHDSLKREIIKRTIQK